MAVDVNMWSSEAWSSAADAYLLSLTRDGSDEAFAELWRRNLPAAHAVARRYTTHGQPEDVVAEAATRVLALLKDGRGPEENFRAYFLSAVRSVAVDGGRRTLRLVPVADDDLEALLDPVEDDVDEDAFAPDLVRAAFRDLSERDQRVLWHTTVEGQAPRVVAPLLGMTANAVSVRAMRAREALRVTYLEAYAAQRLPGARTDECRWALGVLGTHVRGRLPKRATDRLNEHLAECQHEATVFAELRVIQDRFPALLVPLLFLAGTSTPGFLGAAVAAGGSAAVAGSAAAGAGAGAAPAASEAGAVGVGDGPPGGAASGQSSQGAPELATNIAGRVTMLAAALLMAAGVVGAGSEPTVPASAVPGPTATGTTATGPTASSTSSASSPAPSVTTSSASPSAVPSTPAAVLPGAPPPATIASPAAGSVGPAGSVTATTAVPWGTGPGIELRVLDPRVPTRFALRFTTSTSGILKVGVATVSGAGNLTADNSAFTCTNATASSVACTGRDGRLLLTQSGLTSPQRVVVTATDSAGGTTTRTFSLR